MFYSQVVILILGCFTVCWLPYFIVACSQIFKFNDNASPTMYKAAFSLAMANSGMNPIIYAWKNRNFRRAFSHLLRCKAPDSHALIDDDNARQNMKRKSSSLPPSLSVPPPTPNSVITATSPPLSAASSESHHRPSITRYHNTAFPLPPLPPSPQSPLQNASEPMTTFVTESTTALTKCCLKVVELTGGNKGSYILDANIGIDNLATKIDDIDRNGLCFGHPRIIINDDLTKQNFKRFNNNSCNDLFISKLKNNNIPLESNASAPMTPSGNLIVNILENLEANQLSREQIRGLCASTCMVKSINQGVQLTPATVAAADCIVTISKENPGTFLCSSNGLRNTNSIYCNRNSKSRSAPQRINCWSD